MKLQWSEELGTIVEEQNLLSEAVQPTNQLLTEFTQNNPTITKTDERNQGFVESAIAQANGISIEPVADYQFQNDLSSSISGAPDLVDLGNNSFSDETIDGESTTVFEFSEKTGLELSTTNLISEDEYSISALFEFDSVSGFNKIFDFKDRTTDTGLYNDPSGNLDFLNIGDGSSGFEANNFVQVVLTRSSSTDELTGFVNGVETFSVTDDEDLGVFSSENLLTLFRDDTSTSDLENAGGSIARLRLFDQALSESEVSNLNTLPETEEDDDDAPVQELELVVTNSNDSGSGSLRSAIAQANNNEGADTITFANLNGETINLTSGQLEITDSVTIQGLETEQLTIDAGGHSRVFRIDDGDSGNIIDVAISELKISGGSVSIKNNGGGIFNEENLTLTDSTVSGNSSASSGGGIYNQGSITVRNTTLSDNSSNFSGGGISNPGNLTITNSTISDNSASNRGGGIFNNEGNATLTNSTVSGNSGTFGGGLSNFRGNTTLINSTFSGNSAIGENGLGGGISNYESTTTITNSTLSGNSASSRGGGLSNYSSFTTLTNSIVANSANGDIFNNSIIDNQGVNLVEDRSLTRENIINQDPNLSPLQDNGGFTLTHLPLPGSPAIDTGINNAVPPDISDLNGNEDSKEAIPFDQRGSIFFNRVVNGTVDLGATEVQDTTLPSSVEISISDFESLESNDGETATFIFAVSLNEVPSQPVTVDFTTTDGTATAGEDYIANSGSLTFEEGLDGLDVKTIEVEVLGDDIEEGDETFNIELRNPSNGLILSDSNATGTIVDDENIFDPPESSDESASDDSANEEDDQRPTPVPNQADIALKADEARSIFNVDGSGITIGVLSDSFNNLEGKMEGIANGNLPGPGNPANMTPVEVLKDLPSGGSDEGRAMIELMHDIAPGADFVFHTAFNGRDNFAEGINELVEADADIIVDDVFYTTQPFFQKGIVAQAAQEATAEGIPFFSAAGNDGNQSYESEFRVGKSLPQFSDEYVFHDFDPSSQVDSLQEFTLEAGESIDLSFQWDEPFASAGPKGSSNDIDIFLFNESGDKRLAQGVELNVENGNPIELLNFRNLTSSEQTYNLAIGKFEPEGGSNPGLIKYINFGNEMDNLEFDTDSSTVFGHPNAEGVAGVGANPFQKTPEFGTIPPELEPFSSLGGTPILFDTEGNRLSEPKIPKQPRFTAPDATNTSFFANDIPEDPDSFPNFFGTSAAAPHAAAVAALMQQAAGGPNSVTSEQIYQTLENTAINIGEEGFDFKSGFGLIQADEAVEAIVNRNNQSPVDNNDSSTNNEDPTPAGANVFRFYNTEAEGHFYTSSEQERDFVKENLPQYEFEGTSFLAAQPEDENAVPVFRFYNTEVGGHFYTTSEEERDLVKELPKFNFEGTGFYAYEEALPETTSVFRFFNTEARGHFYTPSPEERDSVQAELSQFNFEGTGFYANPVSEA